jgi:hypothetical protein
VSAFRRTCYDRSSMKTLLIRGSTPVPPAVREVITRGSTSLEERPAADVSAEHLNADRIVFWAARGDEDLRTLAARCARAEARMGRQVIVYVTPYADASVAGLAPNELFVWPRDEDRLKMAFMTGA